MTPGSIDAIPLWVIYIFTVFLMFGAVEAGYRLSKRMQRTKPEKPESGIGQISAATLALLGFLLAFIVSYETDIFGQRRQLVIQEANSIGTVYLQAGYLDEPYRTDARNLLRDYVDQRLALVDPAKVEQAVARSEEIQGELWKQAEQLARDKPNPVISLYISSLNDVIDVHTERIDLGQVIRLPLAVLIGLYLVGFLTMLLVGMHTAYSGNRNTLALILLVLILSVVFYLIIDLDRSQEGFLQVPQQALIDLQRQLSSLP